MVYKNIMKKNIERKVYFNGEFVNESEAKISIYDSALMFGDMVFEMTRSFNGKQWKLRRHLERLYSGIKILRIPMPISIDEMEKAVLEIPLKVKAKLSEPKLSMKTLINLKQGDVFPIHIGEGVEILMDDELLFRGEIGEVSGQAAINLTSRITKE